MTPDTYYSQKYHGPYQLHDIGDHALEEGGVIRGCKLAYATFGRLNVSRDNAILITTWYSGTSKIMEQVYVGKGHAIDPDKYFIVIVNQIGNGLSSSPHNTPSPEGRGRFPHVRIGDDVRAQHKLITEKLGIRSLALVIGGSMGAQQTYEWAVRYPDMVKRAAAIAGTAKTTNHNCLITDVLIEAITLDPEFKGGFYTDAAAVRHGLRRHAKIWAMMGCSTEFYRQAFWRKLGFSSMDDFLKRSLEDYFEPMDPNNLLCMAWKWRRGDVSRNTGGDLQAALGRIKAKVFVMPIDEDMLFPPQDCEAEQKMIPNGEYRVIRSIAGHLALFGADPGYIGQIDKHLRDLLAVPVPA